MVLIIHEDGLFVRRQSPTLVVTIW